VRVVACHIGCPSGERPILINVGLPTAYLTTAKNVEPLLNALRSAKAPPKFTQRFLEGLDFKSTNDRLFINVFKALGLLTSDGVPTNRYFEFMDQSQSGRVLAEALEEAYADLFQIRRDAQNMDRAELRGKIKTLTQGQVSDSVVDKMAMTFMAFAAQADFDAPRPDPNEHPPRETEVPDDDTATLGTPPPPPADEPIKLGGFVYNIELHLPDSRDPAVYEALFRALKSHLLS
jgi:hypothetical protein